jgi:glutamine amidotransferase
MIHPIIDEYYNHSPSYSRNSKFAKDKGLVSNAPGAAEAMTPARNGSNTPAASPGIDEIDLEAARQELERLPRVIGREE